MKYGKHNIVAGIFFMVFFMLYGFGLIYMRDFFSGKSQWISDSTNGTHFEAKLAHVHGNLFALLNIIIGFLLIYFNIDERQAKIISRAFLSGMLMPLGIISEFLFGLPPVLVLLGAISIIFGMFYLGFVLLQNNH